MFKKSAQKTGSALHTKKWQIYQSELKRKALLKRSFRRIPFYGLLLCGLMLMTNGIFLLLDQTLDIKQKPASLIFGDAQEKFDKPALQRIIKRLPLNNASEDCFKITTAGKTYQIQSSILPRLQTYILDHIDRKNSRNFGFVAMEPTSGRILSMVSYDKNHENPNICITPDYPAASLFKIITAAAAIEKCGFTPQTPVNFNDNKYTLYKVQLKERINKYTNYMTFAESFANSVNPVFGKIGKNRLGKSVIESYADAFGFNRNFNFEIALKPSTLFVADDPYQWAEVASGFNKDTRISPLHGALFVSGIMNKGKLLEPTLIDRISAEDHVLYRRKQHAVSEIIKPKTSRVLKKLMHKTVISGTASKSFSRFKKDEILSKLNIGGKTGSINNNAQHLKYDWFAGFAEEKNGSQKIVVAVLVVHQDYIGTRAASYSKMAIKEYFKNYYASTHQEPEKSSTAL